MEEPSTENLGPAQPSRWRTGPPETDDDTAGCAEAGPAVDAGQFLTPDVCRRLAIYAIPEDFVLSVVIPAFNEAATLRTVIQKVDACGVRCQKIVVDDGSTDETPQLLEQLAQSSDLTVVRHPANLGKGAALKTGFARCTGNAVIVQDADLEYDPRDYRLLLQPLIEDRADVVYGSRFSGNDRPVSPYWHQNGNRFITLVSNLLTNLKLTDVETGFKLIRRDLIDKIGSTLQERGFGVEIEITAKLARIPGVRFYERPISYAARSYREGKKITWRDGFWALWCALRYRAALAI